MQLKSKSSIYSFVYGKTSEIKFYFQNSVISLNLDSNSMYGMEYIDNGFGKFIINLILLNIY